ncbi:polysaccharide deacetylase family protein [Naasia sp. SYSU D00948]|uniref:polysaccharide deacetylase family protein n=1 Tax=Naasia sp. SYSU D00948 TaxID=2817379 RepID=UPI001B30AB13|nr:polysaccharide deacetylase family protein [Naasia sp. SYSU D00948]
MATLLIGYDVEYVVPDGTTAAFLERAVEVHERWAAPFTMFLLGQTLERNVEALQRAAASPLADVGQHTYAHSLLRPLRVDTGRTVSEHRAAAPERIADELARTDRLLREHLGVECRGLTAPYTYHRGLQGHPELLAVLRANGIRYVRSDGRDERDYQPAPATQPYWYAADGFPEILEMPTHGWHDCVVREDVLGWDDVDGYVALLRDALDDAAAADRILSICAHDWSSVRCDPELAHVDRILGHARFLGMEITSYGAVHARFAAG